MSYHSEVKIKQDSDRQGYDDYREVIKDITPQNITPKDIYKRIK